MSVRCQKKRNPSRFKLDGFAPMELGAINLNLVLNEGANGLFCRVKKSFGIPISQSLAFLRKQYCFWLWSRCQRRAFIYKHRFRCSKDLEANGKVFTFSLTTLQPGLKSA